MTEPHDVALDIDVGTDAAQLLDDLRLQEWPRDLQAYDARADYLRYALRYNDSPTTSDRALEVARAQPAVGAHGGATR